MRTTLTIDDEVAAGLKRIQKRNPQRSFKDIVNDVMKKGLAVNGDTSRVPYKIGPLKKTNPKSGLNFDNIGALISLVEGDFHK